MKILQTRLSGSSALLPQSLPQYLAGLHYPLLSLPPEPDLLKVDHLDPLDHRDKADEDPGQPDNEDRRHRDPGEAEPGIVGAIV